MAKEYLYHASIEPFRPHIGLCLTDQQDAAEGYVERFGGYITEVCLDFEGLSVREFGADEIDGDVGAPGDAGSAGTYGVDIRIYPDGNEWGDAHETVRLASDAAVAATTVEWTESLGDEDEEDVVAGKPAVVEFVAGKPAVFDFVAGKPAKSHGRKPKVVR